MKLLLDTHALLWALSDDAKLGRRAKRAVEDPANEVLVSIVSLWEIVVKKRVGKLDGEITKIRDAMTRSGFRRLAVEDTHLHVLETLPIFHRDPFDHLLVAQAMQEKATIVSDDRAMSRYPTAIMAAAT